PHLQPRIARGRPGETHDGIEHGPGQDLREPQGIEPELIEARDQLGQRVRRRGGAAGPHSDAYLHVVPRMGTSVRLRWILLHPSLAIISPTVRLKTLHDVPSALPAAGYTISTRVPPEHQTHYFSPIPLYP